MIASLLLIAGLLTVQAAPTDAEVARLVRQLDDSQLAQREAAEKELLTLGPAVLDLLPRANGHMSAEVRQRLVRIRQQLQQRAAEATTRASTVTLRANKMPLDKVLEAFQRQTGNPIVDVRERVGQTATYPLLKVDFDRTPFWPALDRTLDQAGLTIYPFADRPAIFVVAAPDGRKAARFGRASYSGPFRIEATSVTARHDPRAPDSHRLVVGVEAAWEPRIRVIGLMQRMADVEATDERGGVLPSADRAAQLEIPVSGDSPAVKFDLPLTAPPRGVERIASLRGRLTAMLPGKLETFRFALLNDVKNVSQRIAGATVTLEEARRTGKTLEVRILVRFDDAGDALASHRTWIFSNPAYLETPDGRRIAYASYDTTRQGRDEVGVAYFFNTDLPRGKLTFIYKTPGVILTKGFNYELKDIRLP